MNSIETLILNFGYIAIFCFMITNGIVSLPSSNFIYIIAGFLVATGRLLFVPTVVMGTAGNVIGNIILYEIARRKGQGYITRWRMFPEAKMVKLHRAFERKGTVIIFVGKFLPGVKVFVPAVAGIANMGRGIYVFIISVTSFLWAAGLTYFGVMFGKNFEGGKFGIWSCVLVGFAIIAIYVFHRYVESVSLEQ